MYLIWGRVKYFSIIVFILLAILGGSLVFVAGKSLFAANECIIDCDQRLTIQEQEKLSQVISQASSYNGKKLLHASQEICPGVNSITIKRIPGKKMRVTIQAHQPTLMLNEGWILSSQAMVIPKKIFNEQEITHLQKIRLVTPICPVELSLSAKKWFLSLNKEITEEYAIDWHNDYKIMLKNKQNPNLSILCTVHNEINQTVQQLCDQIFQATEQKRKKFGALIADIRFDKQIILCAAKGGVQHGKNIS